MSSLLANSMGKLIIRSVNYLRSTAFSTSENLWSKQTVYSNFVRLKFAEVKQQYPSLNSVEIFKKLGEQYRQLTPEQKMQFQVVETAEPEVAEGALSEKRKRLTYAYRHGMPRRPPMSGLNVYIREKLSDLKGVSLSKVAIKLGEAVKDWHSLSQAEQKAYGLKAQELKANYEKELQQWAKNQNLRFTKNLSLLTQRFYERARARGARLQKDKSEGKSSTEQKQLNDTPSVLTAAALASTSHEPSSHGPRSKSPPRSP